MKKNLIPLLCAIVFIAVIASFVKINIINTKILSPLGNTNSNFDLVTEEFGEDLELSWESYLEVHTDSFYSDYDSEFLVVSIEECFEYASDCY